MTYIEKYIKLSDILSFIEKILGKKGPIFLDTKITKSANDSDLKSGYRLLDQDIIIIGGFETPSGEILIKEITMADIKDAFEIIEGLLLKESKKEYIFEEFHDYGNNYYEIVWN